MNIFAFPGYKELLAIPGCRDFSVERFANQELHLTITKSVARQNCLIVGSISPPEETLLSFLMLAHTLKKEGARLVRAFIPYLSYSRQDVQEVNKSRSIALIGSLLKSAGIAEVVTVDVHSPACKKLFPIPLHSLSPAKLFAKEIKRLGFSKAALVAPDAGAIQRTEEVAEELGRVSLVWLKKSRTAKGISHTDLYGTVSEKAVIIDDILDTGMTLISCCQKLQKAGVKEIIVMVTHGLFTGKKWEKLWSLGVKKIYCTNTVPLRKTLKGISVLSMTPLLKEAALWT